MPKSKTMYKCKFRIAVSPHWTGQYMWSASVRSDGGEVDRSVYGFSDFEYVARLKASWAIFKLKWEVEHGKPTDSV